MPLPDFVILLATGWLLTWLLQTNGLLRPLWRLHPLLTEFGECDLCLGFWVYLVLAWLTGSTFYVWTYYLDLVVLAAGTSFAAHLLRLGWQARFGTTMIGE